MPEDIRIYSPVTHEDWQRYYQLRWQVLREPWNQPPGSERDELEDISYHLMAVLNNQQVVGVGRLHLPDSSLAQIRYMAVHENYQRHGIGRIIIHALEQQAVKLGADSVFLNARDTHLGFYTQLGYEPFGIGHVLYDTITHTKVRKRLID